MTNKYPDIKTAWRGATIFNRILISLFFLGMLSLVVAAILEELYIPLHDVLYIIATALTILPPIIIIINYGKPMWLRNAAYNSAQYYPFYLPSLFKSASHKHTFLEKLKIGKITANLYNIEITEPFHPFKRQYYLCALQMPKEYGNIFITDTDFQKNLSQSSHYFNKILPVFPEDEYESNLFNNRFVVHTQIKQDAYRFINPNLMHILNNTDFKNIGIDVTGRILRVFTLVNNSLNTPQQSLKQLTEKIVTSID
ncbi:MAG: hypothetical protein Q7S37_00405 [bacterium]|nr:hypothetical protein [bacterium]